MARPARTRRPLAWLAAAALALAAQPAAACDPMRVDVDDALHDTRLDAFEGRFGLVSAPGRPERLVFVVARTLRGPAQQGEFEVTEAFACVDGTNQIPVSPPSGRAETEALLREPAQVLLANVEGRRLVAPLGLGYGLKRERAQVVDRDSGRRMTMEALKSYLGSGNPRKLSSPPPWRPSGE